MLINHAIKEALNRTTNENGAAIATATVVMTTPSGLLNTSFRDIKNPLSKSQVFIEKSNQVDGTVIPKIDNNTNRKVPWEYVLILSISTNIVLAISIPISMLLGKRLIRDALERRIVYDRLEMVETGRKTDWRGSIRSDWDRS